MWQKSLLTHKRHTDQSPPFFAVGDPISSLWIALRTLFRWASRGPLETMRRVGFLFTALCKWQRLCGSWEAAMKQQFRG